MSVLVSGCFDILHKDHVAFLTAAAESGPLVVCLAHDLTIEAYKGRVPFQTLEHRKAVIGALRCVDKVLESPPAYGQSIALDFLPLLPAIPDLRAIVITEGDPATDRKQTLCDEYGLRLIRLKPHGDTHSISIRRALYSGAPVRVDLAGGWLDTGISDDGFVINCTISPGLEYPWKSPSGLGGSAAMAYARGRAAVLDEVTTSAGWQDAAVIEHRGLCVWKAGAAPCLDSAYPVDLLKGRMALLYVGPRPSTKEIQQRPRDVSLLIRSSRLVEAGIRHSNHYRICAGVQIAYEAQLQEGMKPLPVIEEASACKYCGSGWGGYALYLFPSFAARERATLYHDLIKVEPVQ